MFHEVVKRSARQSRLSFRTALLAEKHWLSNQGALKEERRIEELFVKRTASRLSRRESLKAVRKKLGSEKKYQRKTERKKL